MHLCLSSFSQSGLQLLFIIMRIVHMNPNSSDGLLTWGLPNSRWILNQLERKIPAKDVITRYKILIKKLFFLLDIKIILIFLFYPGLSLINFSIYDKVFISLSKQLRSGDNFGNTLSELHINDPVSLSLNLIILSL